MLLRPAERPVLAIRECLGHAGSPSRLLSGQRTRRHDHANDVSWRELIVSPHDLVEHASMVCCQVLDGLGGLDLSDRLPGLDDRTFFGQPAQQNV